MHWTSLTQIGSALQAYVRGIAGNNSFCSDDRGVSELVGYALIFGVVLFSVTIVSAGATPIISEQQSQNSVYAAENMFTYVDEDVRAVQNGADRKITSVKAPSGQLRHQSATTIEFEQNGNTVTINVTPIEYRAQSGATVLYTGAFTAQSTSGDMLRNPDIRSVNAEHSASTTPMFIIPGLDKPTEISAVAASQRTPTIRFDISQANTSTAANTYAFNSGDGDITVTVDSEHAGAWEQYFEEHPAVTSISRSPNSETFSFTISFSDVGSDTVILTSERIIITFDQ